MTPLKRDTCRVGAPGVYAPQPWQGIEEGYRRLAADESEFAAYRDETAEWSGTDLVGLAVTAAEEYPEYNS